MMARAVREIEVCSLADFYAATCGRWSKAMRACNLSVLALLAFAPCVPAGAQMCVSTTAHLLTCIVSTSSTSELEGLQSTSVAGRGESAATGSHAAKPIPCNTTASAPYPKTAVPVPIYQSWYFSLALLFIAITLPAHLFRRRMTTIKGRIGIVLEERSRIARECHDTLMAGFAAISWQLEATSKLFRNNGLDSTPAAESCELARNMVAHCQAEARRIIWDLHETDEVTGILSQALARSLAAIHLPGAIETRLQIEGEEVPLPPGCVHHLVCIGQEAVTNAIKHAQPSSILVHVKFDPYALYLSIRDDGCGFQSDRGRSNHGHFGIAVMDERARKLGGSFRIQELTRSGTEVMVKVPFNTTLRPATHGPHVIRWIGI